jgi:hypothetical protein
MMKRVVLVLVLAGLIAGAAFAAGGKMQIKHLGDIGKGEVERHQLWTEK